MAFENMDNQPEPTSDDAPPPEESSNRSFLIVAAILGAITLLALACIAAYALVLLPKQRAARAASFASVNAQNTEVAQAITRTAAAALFTATPTQTRVPNTPTRTPTPVVLAATNTPVAAVADPRTATVAALLTQAAGIQRTPTAVGRATSTALPSTGFADEVGVPAMMGMSVMLIAVFFLARRLRTAG
jgi:LPXTG-motif cell wall-anchored protein